LTASASTAPSAVTGWPDNCTKQRLSAVRGQASCWHGGGFYRVILICRSIGHPPIWRYGTWEIPGLTSKSIAACTSGYTLAADDLGIESKSD
jgi:hypothetical protein